jgi:hypothetical protein
MKPKREVVDGAVSLAAEAGWSLGRHFDDNDAGAMAVVGVHVRRGDKVVEAAPPSWKDYAKGAEACALQIAAAAEGNGAPLMPSVRVYVSSDSAASGGEAMWQAEQGWQVQYTTLGGQPHNISLQSTDTGHVTVSTPPAAAQLRRILGACPRRPDPSRSSDTARCVHQTAVHGKRSVAAVLAKSRDRGQPQLLPRLLERASKERCPGDFDGLVVGDPAYPSSE